MESQSKTKEINERGIEDNTVLFILRFVLFYERQVVA